MEWTGAGNGGGDGVMAAVGRTVAGAEEETEPEVEAAELVAAADTAGGAPTLRANMPDWRKAFSLASDALSTIGPPWNCGPTDAQYLLASPWLCGGTRQWHGGQGRGKKRPRARAVGRRGCWHEGRRWR